MSESLVELTDFVCLRQDHRLFRPLALQMGAGETLEISGANGIGKTTFLRALAGLHTQVDGQASVAPFLYCGHRLGLDESLSALKNLQWYAALAGRTVSRDSVREALRSVGALNFGLAQVGALSQGQQRRVAMARWCLDPNAVWLLDEPATALDASGRTLLCSLIDAHTAKGGCVIYSTHQPLPIADKRTLELTADQA